MVGKSGFSENMKRIHAQNRINMDSRSFRGMDFLKGSKLNGEFHRDKKMTLLRTRAINVLWPSENKKMR